MGPPPDIGVDGWEAVARHVECLSMLSCLDRVSTAVRASVGAATASCTSHILRGRFEPRCLEWIMARLPLFTHVEAFHLSYVHPGRGPDSESEYEESEESDMEHFEGRNPLTKFHVLKRRAKGGWVMRFRSTGKKDPLLRFGTWPAADDGPPVPSSLSVLGQGLAAIAKRQHSTCSVWCHSLGNRKSAPPSYDIVWHEWQLSTTLHAGKRKCAVFFALCGLHHKDLVGKGFHSLLLHLIETIGRRTVLKMRHVGESSADAALWLALLRRIKHSAVPGHLAMDRSVELRYVPGVLPAVEHEGEKSKKRKRKDVMEGGVEVAKEVASMSGARLHALRHALRILAKRGE